MADIAKDTWTLNGQEDSGREKKQGWQSGSKQRLECTGGPEKVNMVAGEPEQTIRIVGCV